MSASLTIQEEVARQLQEKGATLSSAESCSGGQVASLLTSIPGASEWYAGGVVAYTKATKLRVLNIPPDELQEGLVTERCARAMAQGARTLFHTDYAVATTGVCGPSGSEGHSPVIAWIAVAGQNQVYTYLYQGPDRGREENREQVATVALQHLLELLRQ